MSQLAFTEANHETQMERYVALETELDHIRVCGLDASDGRDHFNVLEREYVEIGAWLDGYYGEQDAMLANEKTCSDPIAIAVGAAPVFAAVFFAFGMIAGAVLMATWDSQLLATITR